MVSEAATSKVRQVKGYVIDLDGTVYTGQSAIPGSINAVKELQRRKLPFVFLSNRGNYSRAMCKAKLEGMGLSVKEEQIILSSTVTAQYLQQHYPDSPIWALGDPGLREELASFQLKLARLPEEAEWLVITLHETLSYTDLNLAFRAVRSGARIIATNADKMFPGDEGDCIDVAGMIGAIVHTTGKEVELVMGKPSSIMAEAALNVLQVQAEECLVVGDSLVSDVGLGKTAGMQTALVFTGSITRHDAADSQLQPDWMADDLAAVVKQTTLGGQ
ncbi:HAD-IIA family hydrolase [Paenibacillaceae bacterium]|nr:HAD-IIA family hydrolase [Paenibacillaceae bacterium]